MRLRILGIFALLMLFYSLNILAVESPAKEDTTPPPPDGAFKMEQMPESVTIGNPLGSPAAPRDNSERPEMPSGTSSTLNAGYR